MRSARRWAKRSSFLVFALLFCLALPRGQAQMLRKVALTGVIALKGIFQRNPMVWERELSQLRAERALLMGQIEGMAIPPDGCELPAVTQAKVVLREASSWNRHFWIDKGERDNRRAKKILIGKNSPVLLGDSLIGLVDRVEERRSLVTLITDQSVAPAVRAVRGGLANRELKRHLDTLFETLVVREKDFFANAEERDQLLERLAKLDLTLQQQNETLHLAKGYLNGAASVAWRTSGTMLKGKGFNYDYGDEFGSARELHTGLSYSQENSRPLTLLKPGDLLMTSGLDGIFPEGLYVARVAKVAPLQEGSYYYEIEAAMTAGDLEDLKLVSILPPQS